MRPEPSRAVGSTPAARSTFTWAPRASVAAAVVGVVERRRLAVGGEEVEERPPLGCVGDRRAAPLVLLEQQLDDVELAEGDGDVERRRAELWVRERRVGAVGEEEPHEACLVAHDRAHQRRVARAVGLVDRRHLELLLRDEPLLDQLDEGARRALEPEAGGGAEQRRRRLGAGGGTAAALRDLFSRQRDQHRLDQVEIGLVGQVLAGRQRPLRHVVELLAHQLKPVVDLDALAHQRAGGSVVPHSDVDQQPLGRLQLRARRRAVKREVARVREELEHRPHAVAVLALQDRLGLQDVRLLVAGAQREQRVARDEEARDREDLRHLRRAVDLVDREEVPPQVDLAAGAETLAQPRELCQHRLHLCVRAVVRHARPPPAVRYEGDEVDARPHRGDGHERVGDRIRARELAQGLELSGIE